MPTSPGRGIAVWLGRGIDHKRAVALAGCHADFARSGHRDALPAHLCWYGGIHHSTCRACHQVWVRDTAGRSATAAVQLPPPFLSFGVVCTFLSASIFTGSQACEYLEDPFTISDGIYAPVAAASCRYACAVHGGDLVSWRTAPQSIHAHVWCFLWLWHGALHFEHSLRPRLVFRV